MLAWNRTLFLALNGPADPAQPMVWMAQALAASPLVLAPAILAWLWVRGRADQRPGVLAAFIGALAGLAMAHALGAAWYEPRPFMIGLGHTLAAHKVENSFPSDHATLMWSLALGLWSSQASRGWAVTLGVMGLLTAWARVYLGVHFPVDMLGAMAAAVFGGIAAVMVLPLMQARVAPPLQAAYATALRALRLPPKIFPR